MNWKAREKDRLLLKSEMDAGNDKRKGIQPKIHKIKICVMMIATKGVI